MNPLADPSCPGFAEALAAYLENLEDPSADDPFYDEWVQANLSLNEEPEQEEAEVQEEPEDEGIEDLNGDITLEKLNSNDQNRMLAKLTNTEILQSYYVFDIEGGEYKDTVVLQDNVITDNRRALSNLASDANHRKMVRSQYDREQ
jgi:hypothetical protein